jgi:hypothetical protein
LREGEALLVRIISLVSQIDLAKNQPRAIEAAVATPLPPATTLGDRPIAKRGRHGFRGGTLEVSA